MHKRQSSGLFRTPWFNHNTTVRVWCTKLLLPDRQPNTHSSLRWSLHFCTGCGDKKYKNRMRRQSGMGVAMATKMDRWSTWPIPRKHVATQWYRLPNLSIPCFVFSIAQRWLRMYWKHMPRTGTDDTNCLPQRLLLPVWSIVRNPPRQVWQQTKCR